MPEPSKATGRSTKLTEAFLADMLTTHVDKQLRVKMIPNIYVERKLAPEATIRKFRIVQTEGNREVSRTVDHYNLDAILAVGWPFENVVLIWRFQVLRPFQVSVN